MDLVSQYRLCYKDASKPWKDVLRNGKNPVVFSKNVDIKPNSINGAFVAIFNAVTATAATPADVSNAKNFIYQLMVEPSNSANYKELPSSKARLAAFNYPNIIRASSSTSPVFTEMTATKYTFTTTTNLTAIGLSLALDTGKISGTLSANGPSTVTIKATFKNNSKVYVKTRILIVY